MVSVKENTVDDVHEKPHRFSLLMHPIGRTTHGFVRLSQAKDHV